MPTSFDAMQEESRPLALLDPAPPVRPSALMTILSALALLVPVLIVVGL